MFSSLTSSGTTANSKKSATLSSETSTKPNKGIVATKTNNNTTAKNNANNTPLDPTTKQRNQHKQVITLVHSKLTFLAKTVQKYSRKHRDLR